MATTTTATRQVVEDYQRLFVNRRAYTMQSMRPHPEAGRHYYFRPSKKGTDIPLMLTGETIRQHLEGKFTVGLYAINPSSQRCKWVAIDADYKNSMEDLLKLPRARLVNVSLMGGRWGDVSGEFSARCHEDVRTGFDQPRQVKSHSPNDRFVIALRSPNGILQTGLRICP